jgi:hypothetical protein
MKNIIACCFLSMVLMSCKLSHREEVQHLLDTYYSNLKNENFDSCMSFYAESFFDTDTKRSDWKGELQTLQKRAGQIKSYSLANYKEEHTIGKSTIEVELNVIRDSMDFTETISLVPDSKTFRITTHFVDRIKNE